MASWFSLAVPATGTIEEDAIRAKVIPINLKYDKCLVEIARLEFEREELVRANAGAARLSVNKVKRDATEREMAKLVELGRALFLIIGKIKRLNAKNKAESLTRAESAAKLAKDLTRSRERQNAFHAGVAGRYGGELLGASVDQDEERAAWESTNAAIAEKAAESKKRKGLEKYVSKKISRPAALELEGEEEEAAYDLLMGYDVNSGPFEIAGEEILAAPALQRRYDYIWKQTRPGQPEWNEDYFEGEEEL